MFILSEYQINRIVLFTSHFCVVEKTVTIDKTFREKKKKNKTQKIQEKKQLYEGGYANGKKTTDSIRYSSLDKSRIRAIN